MGRAPAGVRHPPAGAEVDAAELIAFARRHLPGFKAPDAVEFGELPKTSTGKVRKNVLHERAVAETSQ